MNKPKKSLVSLAVTAVLSSSSCITQITEYEPNAVAKAAKIKAGLSAYSIEIGLK